ncbi:MAG TPA: alpha/beta hydrolase [Puia sp.]|jgi:pimeloyl-ACP methyl ester carboxylesterase
MKTTILAAALLLTGISPVLSQSKIKKMSTIVLVHGAWSDASAWDNTAPILKAQGYDVITINLPGHGKDNISFAGITMLSYVEVVKKAIGDRRNVILVGHSMAGFVISEVAEQIPDQIKRLIYLAAFLPANGESLLALAQSDPDSHIGKYLQINQNEGNANIAKDGIIDVFAADAPQPVADHLLANFRSEPLAPFAAPATLTEAGFGRVEKVYIYTVNDHAISYTFQQKMVKKSTLARTYALPSSHTPFITMPGVLAAIILQEAK